MEKILRYLTKDFENIVCAIAESKDLFVLLIEELVGSLEEHEQQKRTTFESLDQALWAKLDLKGGAWTQGRGGFGGRG